MSKKSRVCIIGAGAGGLAAIRHVSSSPDLVGTVFEVTEGLGGIWVFSEQTGPENRSPMYRDMRTNLPKEIMSFLDFPLLDKEAKGPGSSFLTHSKVLEYLKSYADHFQLLKYIQFNKKVVSVDPIIPEIGCCSPKWRVQVEAVNSNVVEEHEFDSVIVCTGNFFKPLIPETPDISCFEGKVMHSRDYRVPEPFEGKNVLLVGRGPSGIDIAIEIAQTASQVLISSRSRPSVEITFPKSIKHMPPIRSARRDGFIFENGQDVNCDVLIWCTGYQYVFPFLSPACGVTVEKGKAVSPLYRHMIHTRFPSLCFVGLPFRICPFILFDCQVRFYVKYLEGKIRLPSEAQMEEEAMTERGDRPVTAAHQLDFRQWAYFQKLAQEAGFNFQQLSLSALRKLYEKTAERRRTFPAAYKDDFISVTDQETVVYSEVNIKVDM